MSILRTATISRVPGVLTTDVAGQLVLLSEELRYLGLDSTGRAIWELLETPRTLDELVDELVDRYEVAPDQCRSEVSEFLVGLEKHGIVTAG